MYPLILLFLIHLYSAQDVAEPPPGCGVYGKNFTIAPEWKKLFTAGRNLTRFYKDPACGYGHGHELVRTAIIYLEQIEELENAVNENRPLSMDAVWELYICGGPLHLKQIPYGEFIKIFNWDSVDLDEYSTIIDDTKRVWGRLVEELQRVADRDIII